MEEISFVCPNVEIQAKIRELRMVVKPKQRATTTLEIRIQPQHVTFHIPGGTVKLYCATKGWGSFTLSLEYFYQVLKDYTGNIFAPKFVDGQMQAGDLFSTGIGYTIKNTHPENRPTLELPLNYTVVDILRLKDKISPEQMRLTNAAGLIMEAEGVLLSDLNKVHSVLSKYGITYQQIENMVKRQITSTS